MQDYTDLFWDQIHADIAKYAELGMTAEEITVAIDCDVISYTYVQTVMDQMFKQAA
jgi:hypothetical protein